MALIYQNLERNGIVNETFECFLMPRNGMGNQFFSTKFDQSMTK